jgi:SAM-dependent methyltransferase
MPTIDWNRQKWDGKYHWQQGGGQWSDPWGNSEMQWHGSILPRIHRFVPCATILEIGPGFGRWTEYLRGACRKLIAVDLSARCIDACRARFAADPSIEFHVNDGKSLDMVPDAGAGKGVDFVFSYDSLVHATIDVLEAYVSQIARKLSPQGVAFLHHSNAGEYADYFRWIQRVPPIKLGLRALGRDTKFHARDLDVTAEKVRRIVDAAGLQCMSQEIINWRSSLFLDCHTVLSLKGSQWGADVGAVRNGRFMIEAKNCAALAPLYGPKADVASNPDQV